MNKEQLIKSLLEDFDKSTEINLKFDSDEVKIYSIFTHELVYKDNIQSQNWIDDGYLKTISTFSGIVFDNQIIIHNNFKLSDSHQIDTIKDACYFNLKKALNKFLYRL